MLLEDITALLQASALHRWLGVEFTRVGSGEVEIRLPFRSEFAEMAGGDHGINIHGGIISTLADIAACFAIISQIGRDAVSIDLHVDYLRMAVPGDLVATGRAVKVGRTLGHADVEIHGSDGRLVAVARSKMMTNTPDRQNLTRKTEE